MTPEQLDEHERIGKGIGQPYKDGVSPEMVFQVHARNHWQALVDECRKLRDIVRDIDFFWSQRQSGIAHEAYQDGKGLDDWSPTVELYKRVRDVMTQETEATGRGRE